MEIARRGGRGGRAEATPRPWWDSILTDSNGRAYGFHLFSSPAVDERLGRNRTQESNAVQLHGGKAAMGLDPDCTKLVDRCHATGKETEPLFDHQ